VAAAEKAAPRFIFCLGRRGRDLAACGALSVLIVAAGARLPVYYRATAVRVTVVRVDPDGLRQPLEVPRTFWDRATRRRAVNASPSESLRAIDERIRHVMRRGYGRPGPPGTALEWTIHYSGNSRSLDRTAISRHPVVLTDGD
jgi:hypothetical protein